MHKDLSNEEPGMGWVACRLSKTFPTSETFSPSSLLCHPSEVSKTFELLQKEGGSFAFGAGKRGRGYQQVLFIGSWSLSPLPTTSLPRPKHLYFREVTWSEGTGQSSGPGSWWQGPASPYFPVLHPLKLGQH